ncbi:MAG: hypothetical protein RIS70_2251 [Planctomycetota bacterium]|jgi:uncharacterized protein (TIGR00251 family)
MIALESRPDGIILPVRAQAGSRKRGIVGEHAGALKVAVTQAPERGKANEAILDVLCDALQLRGSEVQLIQGETSPQKKFLIRGLSLQEMTDRIAIALFPRQNPKSP